MQHFELQGDFPVCDRPYARAAEMCGLTEDDLIERIGRLQAEGVLSRFGPLYHAEQMGGELTLAALAVPADRFDEVTWMVRTATRSLGTVVRIVSNWSSTCLTQ